jgi:hypothetical protein
MPSVNPRPLKYTRSLDLFYIDVPRLVGHAHERGVTIPVPMTERFNDLRSLPFESLIVFRHRCSEYVASGAYSAVRINRVLNWGRVRPGSVVSMAHSFVTRGVPDPFSFQGQPRVPQPEPGLAYRDLAGWRFCMDIEARWICTNSGALQFRAGRGYLTGLAVVKTVTTSEATTYATPIVLGL